MTSLITATFVAAGYLLGHKSQTNPEKSFMSVYRFLRKNLKLSLLTFSSTGWDIVHIDRPVVQPWHDKDADGTKLASYKYKYVSYILLFTHSFQPLIMHPVCSEQEPVTFKKHL
jgi:hypothetical protein